MALTPKKRKFATAILDGRTNTEAALEAGYSEKTAPQAGARLAKDLDVLEEMKRKKKVNAAKAESRIAPSVKNLAQTEADPMKFLEGLMLDDAEDPELRFKAAKELMPYKYAKKGELGKKEAKQAAAEKVASRFAQAAPPKLVVVNGR